MQRALDLAEQAVGLASPNPTVGCILTTPGPHPRILGEGVHLYAARDHAEIAALKHAVASGHDVRGATAFVTLEPCAHHGRTGPCAIALVQAGIARVVVANTDPNPLVSGKGLAILRNAGIAITVGPGQQRARTLNLPFAHFIQHHRPFITLKSALSVDGYLAPLPATRTTTAPVWLTGPLARAEVHRLRHASDAILTGIGTVLADNPALTDRSGLPRRRPLLRVILDAHLRTPPTSQILRTVRESAEPDLLFLCAESALTDAAVQNRRTALEAVAPGRVELLALPATPGGHLALPAVLNLLAERQCLSLLLEAGSTLNAAFLHADLVDRAILFFAARELGPGSLPFATGGPSPFLLRQRLTHVTERELGSSPSSDTEMTGLLHDPWPTHA